MDTVPHVESRSDRWGWFFVWVVIGILGALGMISFVPTLPVAVALGLLIWWRVPAARNSALGLLTGAGVLLVYIGWIHRDGPLTSWTVTTCYVTATGGGCDQLMTPLPWLVVGIALVIAGFVVQSRRG